MSHDIREQNNWKQKTAHHKRTLQSQWTLTGPEIIPWSHGQDITGLLLPKEVW